jgi:hypothetical protein
MINNSAIDTFLHCTVASARYTAGGRIEPLECGIRYVGLVSWYSPFSSSVLVGLSKNALSCLPVRGTKTSTRSRLTVSIRSNPFIIIEEALEDIP